MQGSDRAKESCGIVMHAFMKVTGRQTYDMVRGSKSMRMVTLTLACSRMEKQAEAAHIPGLTAKSTKGSGLKELSTGRGCGKARTMTLTSVSGATTRQRDSECTHGRTVISTRVSGRAALNTGRELTCSLTETYISAITLSVSLRGLATTCGKTEVAMQANSKMDLRMGRANGERVRMREPTNTRESTATTRKTDVESFDGLAEMFMRESIRTMNATDKEK